MKAQTLEKQAHIPYILARHLQIDADPDPGYQMMQIHADPEADPDSQH
jgi:hypothetical protein